MRDTPRPLSEIRPGLDRELDALVARCLEKDPQKRPTADELAQRLSPGGAALLEWPPPGLEALRGKLRPVNRLLATGNLLLLATILPLILAGPSIPSVTDFAAAAIFLVPGALGILVLFGAARRAIALGRAAAVAVRSGYSWNTIAEAAADPDGDTGSLIVGSKRFAMLTDPQRNALRRGRLARAVPDFATADEKARIAEIFRPFNMPKDPRSSPLEAGRAYYDLEPEQRNPDPVYQFQVHAPKPRPWTGQKPGEGMFATAKSEFWTGPPSVLILDAATHGFSPGEMAYLRMVATAPVWHQWGIVARAGAGDIIGTSVVLPFSANANWMSVPVAKVSVTKELAYAGASRAAYFLATKQKDSAETVLSETISVGFFLVDNATTSLERLIGISIVGIGRDGLAKYYIATGNPEGPRINARVDSILAARELGREALELDSAARGAAVRTASSARRQLLALATKESAHRSSRVYSLGLLGMAPCTNVRELMFGPNQDVRAAFEKARKDLARYRSDSAIVDMMEENASRGFPDVVRVQVVADGPNPSASGLRLNRLATRLELGAASFAGAVTHNRRIRGCAELVLGLLR